MIGNDSHSDGVHDRLLGDDSWNGATERKKQQKGDMRVAWLVGE
jgi:hypothetical protein